MKKTLHNKKGFTLAELLIVVAIIAVLVAIAIPIFTAQLEKAREATDMANIRAAYAEVSADYLTESKESKKTVKLVSDTTNWKSAEDAKIANVPAKSVIGSGTKITEIEVKANANGEVTIGNYKAVDGTEVSGTTGH